MHDLLTLCFVWPAGMLGGTAGPALSHRFPFLLVDRVLEWESGKYAVGYKCITINDNFFPGHFPNRAIMPGTGWV